LEPPQLVLSFSIRFESDIDCVATSCLKLNRLIGGLASRMDIFVKKINHISYFYVRNSTFEIQLHLCQRIFKNYNLSEHPQNLQHSNVNHNFFTEIAAPLYIKVL